MIETQPAPVKKAMISSTARDLPEHRKQVESACQRVGVFAEKMMENLSAEDANALEVSLRLVDEADVYIGIFANRYGYIPTYDNPTGISITEMEYNRAVERGIPRLIFFAHDDHDWKKADFETGPGAEKLEQFKKRMGEGKDSRVGGFFKNPDDLRGLVYQSLTKLFKEEDRMPPSKKYKKTSFDRKLIEEFRLNELDNSLLSDFFASKEVENRLIEAGLLNGTLKEKLNSLGLSDGDYPMFGTFISFAPKILIIKKFSSCKIKMVVYNGTSRGSKIPIDKEVDGNLITLYHEGERWLFERSGLERIGEIGSTARDELEIPKIVLREALANALVHRNYHGKQKDEPTRLEVYADRVEITSYGSLPDSINVDDLNNNPESVLPIRKNPIIAQIFHWMTFVELNASGVPRIFEETKKAGLPAPKIVSKSDCVRVIIYRNPRKNRSQVDSFIQSVSKAIISSTARDLPEHRKQVIEACQRLGIFPLLMERLPADDGNAVEVTLKMVDEANIYIGIFANRYGYIPTYDNPTGISITEMEYNRAVERGIPRLIFFAHDDHVWKEADLETGPGAEKLEQFKKRMGEGKDSRVGGFFRNPDDLRALVIQSLSQLPQDKNAAYRYHHVTVIPALPAPYIAHPYVLSQAKGLIGRRAELSLLTDWITGQRGWGAVRILHIVAIGGMGKSALTWEWFNKIAPQEWPEVQGRVWWSFYESDARFENFVTRTLAYLRNMPLEEAEKLDPNTRENLLLETLDTEPHLLVLDGFERELEAYTRLDANRFSDDDYEKATANWVAQAHGLPESAAQSFTGQHRLRQAADRRTGLFLRRLTQVRTSRILVSTRLYPFDLQTITGTPLPGCQAAFLSGLNDDDALALWREYGVSGSRERLLPMFRSFGSHPLLLQALASEIARYRPAPGDFDQWQQANRTFDPFHLPLVQAKTHVMQYALQGLSAAERQVLHTIAAFRMPTSYATLLATCSGEGKPCPTASALDATLTQLEDRGLLGWDRPRDRYDLHPVVRGVVWSSTGAKEQRRAYAVLQSHFTAAPMVEKWRDVNSLEDLTPAMELYHALVGLGLLDAAYVVFKDKLNNATLYRLGASRQRVELLEKLFPDGLEQLPRLTSDADKAYTCNALAQAYQLNGEPGRAVVYFKVSNEIAKNENNQENLSTGLRNLSDALRLSGDLPAAEAAARQALAIDQEQKNEFWKAVSWDFVGLALAAKGQAEEGKKALERSLDMWKVQNNVQGEGLANTLLAQHYLWLHQPAEALAHAQRAWEQAHEDRFERDFIRSACRQGQAALGLRQYELAHERLHHALERARKINLVEEELPALIALAELARQQGQTQEARELLDQVWDAAERGPYPLFHADARNVLCQIERDAGHTAAAIEAAQAAYRLAWCQGPPHAYHYGLEHARRHLRELGVAEPEM